MAADASVMETLQAAHDLEATASEKWHKQEHQFKQGLGRYPKLAKWFDHRHKEAADRQHSLRKRMMKLDGTVETNLGDTSYTDDVNQSFVDACDLLDKISNAYRFVLEAARETDDIETGEKFHGYMKKIESIYRKGEQKQQQIKDLGLPLFLHKHS